MRKDPLQERWVIIAPERGRWPRSPVPAVADPNAGDDPFAAGHESRTPHEVYAFRAPGTAPNTPGWDVRVVPNRYPALRVEGSLDPAAHGLYDRLNGIGAHEVIIETPTTTELCDLPPAHVEKVISAYVERLRDLRKDIRLRYHMIFRNKGVLAGQRVPHPHSQLLATPTIPPEAEAKLKAARQHYRRKDRSIFADVIAQERAEAVRVVSETEHFIVLAPFASRFPFELVIYPLRQCCDLTLISEAERQDFARVLIDTLRRLRAALNDPPYQYVLFTAPNTVPRHGRPDDWGTLSADYRWHLEIQPRLESAGMVECTTGVHINPVAPEEAAAYLRGLDVR